MAHLIYAGIVLAILASGCASTSYEQMLASLPGGLWVRRITAGSRWVRSSQSPEVFNIMLLAFAVSSFGIAALCRYRWT